MQTNTRDLGFVNFNGEEMNFIKYNGVVVYEAWKKLIEKGIPPLTLLKCKQAELIDYKIYGASEQYDNIFNKDDMGSGFLPTIGAYPTTNTSYPDSTYTTIDLKAGQIVDITYTGSKQNAGRIRCIDNDTNQVVASVSAVSNDYYTSTTAYYDGFYNGTITAKKDFKLGIMFLSTFPDDFDLQVKTSTPTPKNPIEIESVGEKTKNLINIDECLNEFATKDEDGNIVLQNVFNEDGSVKTRYSNFADVEYEPGTYYFSADTLDYTTSTGNIQLQFKGESGTYYTKQITPALGYNALVFTEKIVAVRLYLNSADTGYVKFNKFQIEKNNKATEFEPYGYKIPVAVSGKNIYNPTINTQTLNGITATRNSDNTYTVNGTATTTTFIHLGEVSVDVGTTYYLSGGTNDANLAFQLRQGTTGLGTLTNSGGISVHSPTYAYSTTDTINVVIVVASGTTVNNIVVKPMICLNETDNYEPYVEPITTNIYLNEPLRKIEDYADYIDFENGKVVRNIGQIIYNGSGTWYSYALSNGYLTPNTIFPNEQPVMCNLFVNSQINIKTLAIRKNFDNLYVYGVSDIYPTVDEWKSFLSNTNMEVIGKLVTPIEETIKLPNIPTHKGTNIIEVDTTIQPSNMEVTHLGKK